MLKMPVAEFRTQVEKGNVCLRSCWDCNPAHEHLKTADYMIKCLGCYRLFKKGQEVDLVY